MSTAQMIPGAAEEQTQWFNELQRIAASPEAAARLRFAVGEIDLMSLLPKVSVPTLVMHACTVAVAPPEEGLQMAGMIPAPVSCFRTAPIIC